MLVLPESQGSGWIVPSSCYFFSAARLSPFTNKIIIIFLIYQLLVSVFRSGEDSPLVRASFYAVAGSDLLILHNSTGTVGVSRLQLLHKKLSLSIKGLVPKPLSAHLRNLAQHVSYPNFLGAVLFLCNHKLFNVIINHKGNSDESQVIRHKNTVTVGEGREEAGEGNGQHGWYCKDWLLVLEE